MNQYNEQLIQIRHFSDQKYQILHVNIKFFFALKELFLF